MLMLVTTAHPSLYDHPGAAGETLHPNLGRLVQPRHYPRVEATAAAGIPWAADNDCYQGLDPAAFLRMLDRIEGVPGCLFVTVPDKVGGAWETGRLFDIWEPALRRRGLPVALVAQDGLEGYPAWLEFTWHRLAALFIGGTTEWKLGPNAAAIARDAKRHGLWVHVGRVNSRRRLQHAANIGADSVDGTQWAMFRHTHLDRGLDICAALGAQPRLFEEAA